ncbi:hypothetical protein [Nocardia pseudovaccinii]|uniref:hypothetical protein n=1 Tax=Nocardia pseudovaccinii TaxID=189540 RepID=UPI0014722FFD|nr:hypothetical protein [Nocardia pseudovaccinii]
MRRDDLDITKSRRFQVISTIGEHRGHGGGLALLTTLLESTETDGIWTVQPRLRSPPRRAVPLRHIQVRRHERI